MQRLVSALLLMLFVSQSSAAIETVCYRGELFFASDPDNQWNGEFVVGEKVAGCYSFNSNTQPSQLDSDSASYYGAVLNFSFGSIFTSVTSSGSEQLNQITLYNNDPAAGDFYTVRARNDMGTDPSTDDDIHLLIGGSGSTDLDAITSLGITELPKLNKYGPEPLEIWFQMGRSGAAAYLEKIKYEVPEPSSLALLVLGVAGLAFNRRHKQ